MSLSNRFFLNVNLPVDEKIPEPDQKEVKLTTPPPMSRAINGNSEFLPEFPELIRASIDNSPISPLADRLREANSKPVFGRIHLGYKRSSRIEFMFLNRNEAQHSDTSDADSDSDKDIQELRNHGYVSDDEKKQPPQHRRR